MLSTGYSARAKPGVPLNGPDLEPDVAPRTTRRSAEQRSCRNPLQSTGVQPSSLRLLDFRLRHDRQQERHHRKQVLIQASSPDPPDHKIEPHLASD